MIPLAHLLFVLLFAVFLLLFACSSPAICVQFRPPMVNLAGGKKTARNFDEQTIEIENFAA
jgi:hypothetical protein